MYTCGGMWARTNLRALQRHRRGEIDDGPRQIIDVFRHVLVVACAGRVELGHSNILPEERRDVL